MWTLKICPQEGNNFGLGKAGTRTRMNGLEYRVKAPWSHSYSLIKYVLIQGIVLCTRCIQRSLTLA